MSNWQEAYPGGPLTPFHSASLHNKLLAIARETPIAGSADGPTGARFSFTPTPNVKNISGVEVPRGGVLHIPEPIHNYTANPGQFRSGFPELKGDKPDLGKTQILAIALEPMVANDVKKMAILGMWPAMVDIKDAEDRTCGPIDEDVTKLESGTGDLVFVPGETGTGVKWCWVFLGAGGGGAVASATETVAIDQSVSAATVGALNPTTLSITPVRFEAYRFVYSTQPGGTNPTGELRANLVGASQLYESRFTVPILVSPGYARIMAITGERSDDGTLVPHVINPDCGEVRLTP